MKKNVRILLPALLALFVFTLNASGKGKKIQPTLGVRSVKIITEGELKFRDLNRNGKLDKYEDWRLSSEDRSLDLLSKMGVEEKVGFMLINTTNLIGARKAEESNNKLSASDFDETGGLRIHSVLNPDSREAEKVPATEMANA